MPEKEVQSVNIVSPNLGKGDKMYYITVDMSVDTPEGWIDMVTVKFKFYGKTASNPEVIRQFRDEVYMALNDLIEHVEQEMKNA